MLNEKQKVSVLASKSFLIYLPANSCTTGDLGRALRNQWVRGEVQMGAGCQPGGSSVRRIESEVVTNVTDCSQILEVVNSGLELRSKGKGKLLFF